MNRKQRISAKDKKKKSLSKVQSVDTLSMTVLHTGEYNLKGFDRDTQSFGTRLGRTVHSWSECFESRDSVAYASSLKEFRVGRIALAVLFFATILYFSRRNRTEHVSTYRFHSFYFSECVVNLGVFHRRRRSSWQAVEMSIFESCTHYVEHRD